MARLLVMEGNTLARQAEAARLGVRSSSGIYIEAVKAHFPEITCDIVHAADRGQALQPGAAFTDYAGLIIGGSGLHAYAKQFEVTNQIDLLKSFSETGKPILGSCWGLQIAAIAGGGTVDRSPNGREVGVARKIALSARGQQMRSTATNQLCSMRPASTMMKLLHFRVDLKSCPAIVTAQSRARSYRLGIPKCGLSSITQSLTSSTSRRSLTSIRKIWSSRGSS